MQRYGAHAHTHPPTHSPWCFVPAVICPALMAWLYVCSLQIGLTPAPRCVLRVCWGPLTSGDQVQILLLRDLKRGIFSDVRPPRFGHARSPKHGCVPSPNRADPPHAGPSNTVFQSLSRASSPCTWSLYVTSAGQGSHRLEGSPAHSINPAGNVVCTFPNSLECASMVCCMGSVDLSLGYLWGARCSLARCSP